ncbi:hypothetical protein BU14_0541s0005 [Porphyra umbilicalis]|uniref:Uncharacterized protein n=1 Tax=Porphyra umbilicalis TaxID=2786 RepID=A0A1X6NS17_PORUM|nr:hypothetical protein BU14_0541s0005 [Porphyra umbilicalis]|eukprot:OSX71382.1 hypothetical protein BU14_0541s0005 [Porphyra umbilicalis]
MWPPRPPMSTAPTRTGGPTCASRTRRGRTAARRWCTSCRRRAPRRPALS